MNLQPLAELAMSLQNASATVMKNAAALHGTPSESPKFVVPGIMDGSRFYDPRKSRFPMSYAPAPHTRPNGRMMAGGSHGMNVPMQAYAPPQAQNTGYAA